MGGADQWGNITAGLELIRRTSGDADESPAHGIAYKLLLSPSGAKFGKSEGGDSVWLDPARTTPYAFYQYWVQADDRDVGHVPALVHRARRGSEIEALDAEVVAHPEQRAAQRELALDVTTRVHGEAEAAARGRASPRRCSSASRSPTPGCWPASTLATRGPTRRRAWATAWRSCSPTPASRPPVARRGGDPGRGDLR